MNKWFVLWMYMALTLELRILADEVRTGEELPTLVCIVPGMFIGLAFCFWKDKP